MRHILELLKTIALYHGQPCSVSQIGLHSASIVVVRASSMVNPCNIICVESGWSFWLCGHPKYQISM